MKGEGFGRDVTWLKSSSKPQITLNEKRVLRTVEFFGGGGGIAEGISEGCRRSGIVHETYLANEYDDDLLAIYTANHRPNFSSSHDILDYLDPVTPRDFDEEKMKQNPNKYPAIRTGKMTKRELEFSHKYPGIKNVDLLVGGPPCQGNSDLNNKSRRVDKKNLLYFTMLRFSRLFKPKIVIIENVKQVIHSSQEVVQRSQKGFEKLGYSVQTITVKGSDVGVAQKRERHFFFASRVGELDLSLLENGIPEFIANPRTVRWALEGIDESLLNQDLFNTTANSNSVNKERMKWLIDNDEFELPNYLRPDCHKEGHSYPAVYGRMYPDRPADTISTGFASNGQGRFTHPWAKPGRTITPHEAAAIQSFPEYYQWPASGIGILRTAIGNAVPPLLAMHVSMAAINLLVSEI